jgi:hypothetical protein
VLKLQVWFLRYQYLENKIFTYRDRGFVLGGGGHKVSFSTFGGYSCSTIMMKCCHTDAVHYYDLFLTSSQVGVKREDTSQNCRNAACQRNQPFLFHNRIPLWEQRKHNYNREQKSISRSTNLLVVFHGEPRLRLLRL